MADVNLKGWSNQPDLPGVVGEGVVFEGVRGISHASWHGGVVGINDNNNADKTNPAGPGVFGTSQGTGVQGDSQTWMGVYGSTRSTIGGAGVMGEHPAGGPGVIGKSDGGIGVYGISATGEGVHAETNSAGTAAIAAYQNNASGIGAAVYAENRGAGPGGIFKGASAAGVYATSAAFEAVHAESSSPSTAAIAAYQLNPAGTGAALYAKSNGKAPACFFDGDVTVTGDVYLTNRDVAERFLIEAAQASEPGTVMVTTHDGMLTACTQAYDRRVVGVVSGAGALRPAMTLGEELLAMGEASAVIALIGTANCRADASHGAIRPGDFLTTSPTPGHAMRADDDLRSRGAIIGKALGSLAEGRGLVMMLVALQ